jgi:hypothetical protein
MSSTANKNKHDDPTGTGHKHRWQCPGGHVSWERINSHVWCHACAEELHGDCDADPEWECLVDTRNGEHVPVEELVEEWPDFDQVPAY